MSEAAETSNNNKVKIYEHRVFVSIMFNLFSSLLLGTFPTIIYYFAYQGSSFGDKLKEIITSNVLVVYYAAIAAIAIFIKYNNYIATRKCGDCTKGDNLGLLSSRMFEPLIGVYQAFSGFGIAAFLTLFRDHIAPAIFILLFSMVSLLFVAIFEAEILKKYKEVAE